MLFARNKLSRSITVVLDVRIFRHLILSVLQTRVFKGPRALKAQLKRKRLAAAATATVASFLGSSASRTSTAVSALQRQDEDDETRAQKNSPPVPEAANGHHGDNSAGKISSKDRRLHFYTNDQDRPLHSPTVQTEEPTTPLQVSASYVVQDPPIAADHRRRMSTADNALTTNTADNNHCNVDVNKNSAIIGGGGGHSESPNKSRKEKRGHNNKSRHPAQERRDTLTLVSGMEVGGLLVSSGRRGAGTGQEFQANSTRTQSDLHKKTKKRGRMSVGQEFPGGGGGGDEPFGLRDSVCAPADDAVGRMPGLMGNTGAREEDISDKSNGVHSSRGSEESAKGEEVWRASLFDHRQTPQLKCPRERGYDGGGGAEGYVLPLEFKDDGAAEGSWFGTMTKHPTTSTTTTINTNGSVTKTVSSPKTKQQPAFSSTKEILAANVAGAVRGNLPPEVLANILLSDCNVVGNKAYEDVLDRARQWGRDSARVGLGEDCGTTSSPPQKKPLQSSQQQLFPDVPYGFTEIGRRVNSVGNHGSGSSAAPAPKSHVKQ